MPTRRTFIWLAAALITYLIAWNVGSGWLYVVTALLVAFPLLSLAWSRLNVGAMDFELGTPATARHGDRVVASLRLVNRSRFPRWFLRLDLKAGGGRGHAFVPVLGGRESLQLAVTIADVQRGIYSGASLAVSSSGPLGLASARRLVEMTSPVVVFPAWREIGGDWGFARGSGHRSATVPLASRAAAADYLGVRDYRPEDSPRSIHWRTSARLNQLAVVEYSRRSLASPVFIVDTTGSPVGTPGALEHALAAAASLARREADRGRPYGIGSSPDDACGRGLCRESSEALFRLAGAEAESREPLALDRPLSLPDTIPVLILPTHECYGDLDSRGLVSAPPGSIVVFVDTRCFGGGGMDDAELGRLRERLGRLGTVTVVLGNEAMEPCLEAL